MTPEQQRKMLECAAKACGIDGEHKTLHYFDGDDTGICSVNHPIWNPLTNPGDTAEMCAKLEIDTTWLEYGHMECGQYLGREENYVREEVSIKDHNNDREAAWRYAATMVAAKIGGYTE